MNDSARHNRRNWSGNYEYQASRLVAPTSREELRALIQTEPHVRALGTRHSFNSLPDTEGTLIELTSLPTTVQVNAEQKTARVSAWTRYGIIAQELERNGLAMHNMGSLPHINVGGATATATHGSGDQNGCLTTAVRAITYLDAGGESHTVGRDDPDFAALAVGLGAFGIVTDLELDVQPSYRVRQDVYEGVTWETALADFDSLTGAGASVSVFTRWDDEEHLGFVWVKRRLETDEDVVADHLLDGSRSVDASPLGSDENVTELGTPGPWLLRLPHFRLDREPSFGAEIQTEYLIDRRHAREALLAVRALAPQITPLLVWSELRTIAADDLWLSMAYGRDSLAIHFTWHRYPAEVAAVIPLIERALAPFDPRPHWGKLHSRSADELAASYAHLPEARAVFERLDPGRKFVNQHLVALGIRHG